MPADDPHFKENFTVFDFVRKKLERDIVQNNTELNMSEWASGMYFLKIRLSVQRFSVQH